MKYFIVADVHSFYNQMKYALDRAGFDRDNPEHIFVSCGDLFDRGNQPQQCLEFVMSLDPERRIFIRGNHEDLMEEAITRMGFLGPDLTNGTVATAHALTNTNNDIDALIALKSHSLYNAYIRECIDYAETAHYIFVHGWIPHNVYAKGFNCDYTRHNYIKGWRDADREHWEAARWYNGMESWADGVREPGKTIVCGHWNTSWARCYIDKKCNEWSHNSDDFRPWVRPGIIAMDACTGWSGIINCYVLEDYSLK